jgi:hypothetical protein
LVWAALLQIGSCQTESGTQQRVFQSRAERCQVACLLEQLPPPLA